MTQDNSRKVVVDTTRNPLARLDPLPLTAVALNDAFWAPRLAANREITIPSQYRLLEDTGRFANFRRAAGKAGGDFRGLYFNDSDVYKWVEAASWALAVEPDEGISEMVNSAIADIAAAQRDDGYLNTYFSLERADQRWTNLRDMHELYCAGHLFQGAIAHHRATGSNALLDVAVRFADHICDTFGAGGGWQESWARAATPRSRWRWPNSRATPAMIAICSRPRTSSTCGACVTPMERAA